MDWFQNGKGVHQSCILSPCLFSLYAEYIMRNAKLDEVQAGIKIAGRTLDPAASKQEEEPTCQRQPGGAEEVTLHGCPLRLLRCQEVRRPPVSPAWASWNQGSPALELRGKEVLTGAQQYAPPPLRLPSHPPIFPPPQCPSGAPPPTLTLTPFPAPE